MPIYTYKCTCCSAVLEYKHGMLEDIVDDCPQCGRSTLKRTYKDVPGIIYNCGGFYSKGG